MRFQPTLLLLLVAAAAPACPPPEAVAAMVDAALASKPPGIGPQQCSEPVSLPYLARAHGFALVVVNASRGVVKVRACALAAERPPASEACAAVGLTATLVSDTDNVNDGATRRARPRRKKTQPSSPGRWAPARPAARSTASGTS